MKNPNIAPGQVWWCDGAALEFEKHFKMRPVLVVEAQAENWIVMPLSSKRRFGQEPLVTHGKTGERRSYMTAAQSVVPARALKSYSGDWQGFPVWRNSSSEVAPRMSLWKRLSLWLSRRVGQSGTSGTIR